MARLSIRKKYRGAKAKYRVSSRFQGRVETAYYNDAAKAGRDFKYCVKNHRNATFSVLNPVTNKYRKTKKVGWK